MVVVKWKYQVSPVYNVCQKIIVSQPVLCVNLFIIDCQGTIQDTTLLKIRHIRLYKGTFYDIRELYFIEIYTYNSEQFQYGLQSPLRIYIGSVYWSFQHPVRVNSLTKFVPMA